MARYFLLLIMLLPATVSPATQRLPA